MNYEIICRQHFRLLRHTFARALSIFYSAPCHPISKEGSHGWDTNSNSMLPVTKQKTGRNLNRVLAIESGFIECHHYKFITNRTHKDQQRRRASEILLRRQEAKLVVKSDDGFVTKSCDTKRMRTTSAAALPHIKRSNTKKYLITTRR